MSYWIHAKQTCSQTEADLRETFDKWGVGRGDWSVEYNVPRASLGRYTFSRDERAVTVRWLPVDSEREVVLSLDTQERPADNLRALYLGIESIRMNEKRGIDTGMMRAAYLQLAGPVGPRPWYEVLQVSRGAPLEVITASWRALARSAHPDVGGSVEAMAELNDAYERAKADRGAA